jgi:RNA polymerase sigma-70 factor (ECF subfamily)
MSYNESEVGLSPQVVDKLVESHRLFLAFLEKRLESRAIAEDILQEAFIKGIQRGETLRDDESAVAWFYRILRNAVVDHYRRRASADKAMDSFAREFGNEEPDEAVQSEICQCVMGVLDTLKPEYRDALRTVDLGDGTMDDLARQASISLGNAAVRVHRAREALRKRVRSACGTCAEHGCLDCHCRPEGSECH